jgi:agmatinase
MVNLIGIPFDANSSFLSGAALAPPRIRQMDLDGSANSFSETGLEIKEGLIYRDLGDLVFENTDPAKAFEKIRDAISKALGTASKIISIGGDHSITYPVLDAFLSKFKGLNVLHLDAHGDLYDNFDGNPYSHASPFARIMETGKINSLTQVGIRTLTPHQRDQARRFGVRQLEMNAFNFDFVDTLKAPLYVSIDLDVLDPAFAPGVSHHEPGGLSSRDLIHIIQALPVAPVGADIVEYNPTRDLNNMTAMVGYKLMKEFISRMVGDSPL